MSDRRPDFSLNPTGLPTNENPDVEHIEVTYDVPSDFDKERSDKISGFHFTPRAKKESDEAYYYRMYKAALA